MHDVQPKEQGLYDPVFMVTLVHFLRTRVNIEGWAAQDVINKISTATSTAYNESLER
jgi:hypothetical protein